MAEFIIDRDKFKDLQGKVVVLSGELLSQSHSKIPSDYSQEAQMALAQLW